MGAWLLDEPRLGFDRPDRLVVQRRSTPEPHDNDISPTQHRTLTTLHSFVPYWLSCNIPVYWRAPLLTYLLFVAPHQRANAPIMGALSYFQSIYALDTIDTRFTGSATTPHKAVADTRAESTRSNSKKDSRSRRSSARADSGTTQPSLWNTKEFYLYYFVIITCVPYMFWIAYDVSRRAYPRNWQCFDF